MNVSQLVNDMIELAKIVKPVNQAEQIRITTTSPHCMTLHKANGRIIIVYGDEPSNYIAPPFIGDTIEDAVAKLKRFFHNGLKAQDQAYRAAAERFAQNAKPLVVFQIAQGNLDDWLVF